MAVFTIDLYVAVDLLSGNRGHAHHARYAIEKGALEACHIASALDDDTPPKIVVRAHRVGHAGNGVVLVEFTATDEDEIAAASTSVVKRLGSERKVQRAILRVPQGQSQDLLRD
jgi:hypothetical protein